MFLDGRTRKDLTPSDEYEKWCQLEPFQHDNALSYWIENRSRWPKLSRMAIDVFSIPAMSAELERVFSIAGVMCSPRRSRLNAKSIQVCRWLRKCRSTVRRWWKRCTRESHLYILSGMIQPQYRTELFSAWGSVYSEMSNSLRNGCNWRTGWTGFKKILARFEKTWAESKKTWPNL